jgi:hypothetical protein
MDAIDKGFGSVNWICQAQDKYKWRSPVNWVMDFQFL